MTRPRNVNLDKCAGVLLGLAALAIDRRRETGNRA
jgi:hypothetical protein